MIAPTCVFYTRHDLTDDQRRDFIGYRVLHVGKRADSIEQMWLHIVLASGDAPAIVVAVIPAQWQARFVRHVARLSPSTIVLRAITMRDNWTPTGVYKEYRCIKGGGVCLLDYDPPRVKWIKQRLEREP